MPPFKVPVVVTNRSSVRTTALSFENRTLADVDENGIFPLESIPENENMEKFDMQETEEGAIEEEEEELEPVEISADQNQMEEENVAEDNAPEENLEADISVSRAYNIQYLANRRKARRTEQIAQRAEASINLQPMDLPSPAAADLPPPRDLSERPGGSGSIQRRRKKSVGRAVITPFPLGTVATATLTKIKAVPGIYLEQARREYPEMFLPIQIENCLHLKWVYEGQPGKAESVLNDFCGLGFRVFSWISAQWICCYRGHH